MTNKWNKWKRGIAALCIAVIAAVLLVWGTIDGLTFRFSHVDYSETRLFLENWDAWVMMVASWVLMKIGTVLVRE